MNRILPRLSDTAAMVGILLAVIAILSCGGGDRTAELREEHPGASECLGWKSYVLIRYPYDDSTDTRPAVLLRLENNEWIELGRSKKGFESLHELMTYIPEMDESGVEAFGLH